MPSEIIYEPIEEFGLSKKNVSRALFSKIGIVGITDGEKRAILSRIKGSVDFKDLKECDFVIESIRAVDRGGKIRERKDIMHKIEMVVDPHCIIATHSTTIVITELSSDLKHRDRCVSLHFFINSQECVSARSKLLTLWDSIKFFAGWITFIMSLVIYGINPIHI